MIHAKNDILACGGGKPGQKSSQKCLTLRNGKWVHHSNLTKERVFATAIDMPKGTYIFGSSDSPTTWEWLPTGETTWQKAEKT